MVTGLKIVRAIVAGETDATVLAQHRDHRCAASEATVAAARIPPSRERPMTWRTSLRAHWQALVAADFFTNEVWTSRGLVTTAFVIERHSRRVHILGSTPHPDQAFVVQTLQKLTDVDASSVRIACRSAIAIGSGVLSCGFPKWRVSRLIRTPHHAPNCNAHAERFVSSLKEKCLDRIVPISEGHLRRTLTGYVGHYHGERNHQGLDNVLIDGSVRRRAGVPFVGASASAVF